MTEIQAAINAKGLFKKQVKNGKKYREERIKTKHKGAVKRIRYCN